jgi:hypothetical protein
MAITGKDEFEVDPARAAVALEWVAQMERAYRKDGFEISEHLGPASDHGFAFDRSVGGVLISSTGRIHLFYAEVHNLASKAEELAHYFQYKKQGLIGQTEAQIGADRINANEIEIVAVLTQNGFRRRR